MPWEIRRGSSQCSGYGVFKEGTDQLEGCHQTREKALAQMAALYSTEEMDKAKNPCWEGYRMEGMKPSDDGSGAMVPNCIPVGSKKVYDGCGCSECKAESISCNECDACSPDMSKSESYKPTAGMKAAAQRALKWKEDGKATGAGTPIGWGRASDIVAGRSMSLSTVKRMHSFFSRHEVDKKGKDFYNTSNPSNGRIMWDAWGGDAGFSWSRKISQRDQAKKLWKNSAFF